MRTGGRGVSLVKSLFQKSFQITSTRLDKWMVGISIGCFVHQQSFRHYAQNATGKRLQKSVDFPREKNNNRLLGLASPILWATGRLSVFVSPKKRSPSMLGGPFLTDEIAAMKNRKIREINKVQTVCASLFRSLN
jgi:hypothetical protein